MDVSVTAVGRLLTAWDWEPSILIGCAALAGGYCVATRCRVFSKALYFFAGVLLLALDLMSPLDRLADEYLLSAHIAQHFLLALIVPPLLLLGISARDLEKAMARRPLLSRLEHYLGNPAIAWPLGVGAMLVWHVPALFNAALTSESLHIFQHLCFLATGTIYWWPVVSSHLWGGLATCGGLETLSSAVINRAQDSILPHMDSEQLECLSLNSA
jgi:cytochrome c oxidase assembly factor CtaG